MKRYRWVLSCVLAVALVFGPAASGSAALGASSKLSQAIAAQERHTPRLLTTPGVVGTGVGLDAHGSPQIVVLTKSAGVTGVPSSLDGIRIGQRVTGSLAALHHREGHGGPG